MGDFNAVPHSDEIRWLSGLTTLNGRRVYYQDAWDMIHPERARVHVGARQPLPRPHVLAARRPPPRLRVRDAHAARPPRHGARGAPHLRDALVMAGGERLFASDHYGVLAEVQFLAEDPDARARAAAARRARARRGGACSASRTSPTRTSAASPASASATSSASALVGALNLVVNRTRKHKMAAARGAARGPARAGGRPPRAHGRSLEHLDRGRVAERAAPGWTRWARRPRP